LFKRNQERLDNLKNEEGFLKEKEALNKLLESTTEKSN